MELTSGYGLPYDPELILKKLSTDRDSAIETLWENLYHQGDIGTASYAAVPELVKHGELSLVAAIETARNESRNPALPAVLADKYMDSLKAALNSSPRDEEQYQGYYIIHASLHGQNRLAKALFLLSVEEILNEYS